MHNPARLFEIYGPLIDYLNRNIPGATFRLEASRNYEEFEKKLYARQFDFALPNPYQTLNSLGHGYHVIAKMGDVSIPCIPIRTDAPCWRACRYPASSLPTTNGIG
ncbi:MAG TPA: PhnD/SsuA/transferrin family substrate-binding protein [Gallionella sp.]